MAEYKKTLEGIIDDLEVLVEHVQTEVCDDICKHPEKVESEEELRALCDKCPLNKLD